MYIYDLVPSSLTDMNHLIGPLSMSYAMPAFTVTYTAHLTPGQQIIVYTLTQSDGSSIASLASWLTFDDTVPSIVIDTADNLNAGTYNFVLTGELQDPLRLTGSATF